MQGRGATSVGREAEVLPVLIDRNKSPEIFIESITAVDVHSLGECAIGRRCWLAFASLFCGEELDAAPFDGPL